MTNIFKRANSKLTAISQRELCELKLLDNWVSSNDPLWDNSDELSVSMVLAHTFILGFHCKHSSSTLLFPMYISSRHLAWLLSQEFISFGVFCVSFPGVLFLHYNRSVWKTFIIVLHCFQKTIFIFLFHPVFRYHLQLTYESSCIFIFFNLVLFCLFTSFITMRVWPSLKV